MWENDDYKEIEKNHSSPFTKFKTKLELKQEEKNDLFGIDN